MLLHKNNKLIYKNRIAVKLPNNAYLDPSPDPVPLEGIVMFSEDLRTKIELSFLETEKSASGFLQEAAESFENFELLEEMSGVCANTLLGVTMTYSSSGELCEEYVYSIPDNTPVLLDICLVQKKDAPSEAALYERLIAELMSGIEPICL